MGNFKISRLDHYPVYGISSRLISLPKSNGAVVENAVVCLFLLVASVLRGIFGNEKKKYLVELALLVAGILGAGVAFFYKYTFLPSAMCSPGLRIQVNLDIRTE